MGIEINQNTFEEVLLQKVMENLLDTSAGQRKLEDMVDVVLEKIGLGKKIDSIKYGLIGEIISSLGVKKRYAAKVSELVEQEINKNINWEVRDSLNRIRGCIRTEVKKILEESYSEVVKSCVKSAVKVDGGSRLEVVVKFEVIGE